VPDKALIVQDFRRFRLNGRAAEGRAKAVQAEAAVRREADAVSVSASSAVCYGVAAQRAVKSRRRDWATTWAADYRRTNDPAVRQQ